ncbi:MAG: helix-turn-helix transcriptional regulator [Spirochaetia bacterium]|jgi:DNA-binding CsgD family transcriptional regulator
MGDAKVQWPRLREYLLELSSCQTRSELMRTACLQVQTLIPFDAAAGIFDSADARYLEGVGQSDAVNASYNAYYRKRQPLFLDGEGHVDMDFILSTYVYDWRKVSRLEYAVDFMFPNGMFESLSHVLPGHRISLAIQRSRFSPHFSDQDVDTLGIINEHLNTIFSGFDRRWDASDPALSVEGISARFSSLSRRETEICFFVARRLTTAEIAACLFISRRTVEKHMESIFDKLGARSRDQLRWHLGVMPPKELWHPE